MRVYTGKMPVLFFLFFLSGLLFADVGILDKVQMAIDPSGKLAASETKVTEGVLEMPAQKVKAEVKSYFKKPDKYRIDTIFADGAEEIRSFDGDRVWKWSTQTGKIEEVEGLDKESFVLSAKMETPDMREWSDNVFNSMSTDYTPIKVNGNECMKLVCVLKEKFGFKLPLILYIDKDSYLVQRMDMPCSMNGRELLQSIVIENYKKDGDTLFPSIIKSSIFGAEIDYRIKDIRFNESIKDSFFTELSE